ncbi:MAG: hypothetical protein IAI48_17470 [Candidatus Eremiobacteraeota bacterium]|nr:hypothetical protein [Candidatus Eremiobacteraeota bacterium]
MFRLASVAALVLAAPAIASAQIAPPPGAVTHQGTKTYPSPGPKKSTMHAKSTHSKSMMMHGTKASPKPKT